MLIRKFSHSFCVVTNDQNIQKATLAYYNRLTTYKFGKGKGGKKEKDKVFASANIARTHFRMLNASYESYMCHLSMWGIDITRFKFETVKSYTPAPAKMKCIFPYPLRPKQVEIKDFILEPTPLTNAPDVASTVPLQMGGGKTLISLYIAAMMGVRVMVEVSRKYYPNWEKNICGDERKLDVDPKDVLFIASTNDLIRALKNARDKYVKFDYKVIICTKGVVSTFVSSYVREPDKFKAYGIKVEDLYKTLQVGLVIRDEAHEELWGIANQDLHLHRPLTINLSATLEYDDHTVNEMAKLVFPIKRRYDGGAWNKYVDVLALHYNLLLPTKLKWQLYKTAPYSQAEFEKSIIKNKKALANYLEMTTQMVQQYFIDIHEPGDVCAVYSHTIEMCTLITNKLNDEFNNLVVNRYVGEDNYENLMKSDIVVTTPGSGGTGVDIKGLRLVLMLCAIKSSQKNYQIEGRLRELFDLDRNGNVKSTTFCYGVCDTIPQQVDYHKFKKQKFLNKVKSHGEVFTPYLI